MVRLATPTTVSDGFVKFRVEIINIPVAREHFGGGLWLTCNTCTFFKIMHIPVAREGFGAGQMLHLRICRIVKFQGLEKGLEGVSANP